MGGLFRSSWLHVRRSHTSPPARRHREELCREKSGVGFFTSTVSRLQIGVSVETGNDRNKVHPDQPRRLLSLVSSQQRDPSPGLRRGLLIGRQVSKVARKAQACGFFGNDGFDEVEEILMIPTVKRKTAFSFSRFILMQVNSFQTGKTQTPVLERFRFNMSFTGDLEEI